MYMLSCCRKMHASDHPRHAADSLAWRQMWISKDEYKDAGKVIVHRKCF
jgi:hypothetical protein